MPYRAIIEILIDVKSQAEAMDAVAETMRPIIQSHNPTSWTSCFRDWNWYDLIKTQPIHENFLPDDEWPNDAK